MALRLAVLGRDAREWAAARILAGRGHDVAYVGPAPAGGVAVPGGPARRASLPEACRGRQALIGPVQGASPEYIDPMIDGMALLAPDALVATGRPPDSVREAARRAGLRLVDWQAWEPLALLNAVPTAEGAIVEAVTAARRAIWRSRAVVVGYGRVGRALAARLRALGAEVTVCAPTAEQRAAAAAGACRALPLDRLPDAAAGADFLFNTVPAPVIGADALGNLPDDALLMDLASPPGGFDRPAVEVRGIALRRSPGIPGRVVPLTAGLVLADVVEELVPAGGGA